MAQRLFLLLTVVWVGSQLTIGYLVAPVLFSSLDRMVAGTLAAALFRCEGVLGLVCGVVLLLLCNRLVREARGDYRPLRRIVLAMLACVALGYFAIEPFMHGLRQAASAAGSSVSQAPYAARFGMLHGLSTAIYVVQSVLGILLLFRLPVVGIAGIAGIRGRER